MTFSMKITQHGIPKPFFQCMLRYNQRPTQLLMGGIQEKMISFDLVKGKETQVVDTGGTCAVLRYHGRYVGCGDTSGKIQLRDPHSLTLQHTLDTHSGRDSPLLCLKQIPSLTSS